MADGRRQMGDGPLPPISSRLENRYAVVRVDADFAGDFQRAAHDVGSRQFCIPDQCARGRQRIRSTGTDREYTIIRLDDVACTGEDETRLLVGHGEEGFQPTRIIGIEGPRWMLRATFLGREALEPNDDSLLMQALHDVVVVRGDDPRAPRDALLVTIGQDLEVVEGSDDGPA